jgi:hypothetical protein
MIPWSPYESAHVGPLIRLAAAGVSVGAPSDPRPARGAPAAFVRGALRCSKVASGGECSISRPRVRSIKHDSSWRVALANECLIGPGCGASESQGQGAQRLGSMKAIVCGADGLGGALTWRYIGASVPGRINGVPPNVM